MVICLERGADLHMAQLMPLPLTVSCFSKIQIGFTFLVPAYPSSPGKRPLSGCVCCRRSLAAQQRARAKEAISQTKSLQSSMSVGKKALQASRSHSLLVSIIIVIRNIFSTRLQEIFDVRLEVFHCIHAGQTVGIRKRMFLNKFSVINCVSSVRCQCQERNC